MINVSLMSSSCGTATCSVAAVYDQAAGETWTLSRATQADQPIVWTAGSPVLLNGKPAAQFDVSAWEWLVGAMGPSGSSFSLHATLYATAA